MRKVCDNCAEPFDTEKKKQRFCVKSCGSDYHNHRISFLKKISKEEDLKND